MFKKRATQTALLMLGLTFLVGVTWILGGANNYALWQMSRSLSAIAHPTGTQFVASSDAIGLLAGNGDHCDFFVGELRSNTSLSPAQLRSFYANTSIWNPRSGRREQVSVATIKGKKLRLLSSGEEWTGLYEFMNDHFGADWPRKASHRPMYVVFIFDVGYDAGCDFRCT